MLPLAGRPARLCSGPCRGASSFASADSPSADSRCRDCWQANRERGVRSQELPPHLHGRRAEPSRTLGLEARRAAEIRGEFKPIRSSVPGLTVGELLPLTAKQMHHFAQVRSVHHGINDHNAGSYYMLTGRSPVDGSKLDPDRLRHHLPRRSARSSRRNARPRSRCRPMCFCPSSSGITASISADRRPGFLGAKYDPFVGGDPSLPGYRRSRTRSASRSAARPPRPAATISARHSIARSASSADAAARGAHERVPAEGASRSSPRPRPAPGLRPVPRTDQAPRALWHGPRQ